MVAGDGKRKRYWLFWFIGAGIWLESRRHGDPGRTEKGMFCSQRPKNVDRNGRRCRYRPICRRDRRTLDPGVHPSRGPALHVDVRRLLDGHVMGYLRRAVPGLDAPRLGCNAGPSIPDPVLRRGYRWLRLRRPVFPDLRHDNSLLARLRE